VAWGREILQHALRTEGRCGVDVPGSGWASFLKTRKVLMVRAYVFLSFTSTGVCQVSLFRGTGFAPEWGPALN